MFWGRFITEPKIVPVVRFLFSSRVDSFFDANITSRDVLPRIWDSLYKYNLIHYLELWFSESIFPTYTSWKTIVKTEMLEKEADNWHLFCAHHLSIRVAQACLENISSDADLFRHLHAQIMLIGNFGLNGIVLWLTNTDIKLCLLHKESLEMSAISYWTALILEVIANLFGQT